jgi:hypothetical protein
MSKAIHAAHIPESFSREVVRILFDLPGLRQLFSRSHEVWIGDNLIISTVDGFLVHGSDTLA